MARRSTKPSQRSAVLYHVTLTAHVPKIRKKGILRQQTSNWVQRSSQVRYGAGEIYAFEDVRDAIQWAGRMDWEFHTALGSGKISIVEFLAGSKEWVVDENDPLSQAGSKGRWLKSLHPVKPDQIVGVSRVDVETIRGASK